MMKTVSDCKPRQCGSKHFYTSECSRRFND